MRPGSMEFWRRPKAKEKDRRRRVESAPNDFRSSVMDRRTVLRGGVSIWTAVTRIEGNSIYATAELGAPEPPREGCAQRDVCRRGE